MAFATEYMMRFKDTYGISWLTNILKDAFAGSISDIQAAGEPLVFEHEAGDDDVACAIHESRAAVSLISNSQFQYAGLYSTEDMERKIEIIQGANLITSWSNDITDPYETLTKSGLNITSAINSSGSGLCQSNSFNVTDGETIILAFYYTKNSGTSPVAVLLDAGWTLDDTSAIAEGWNYIELVAEWTGAAYLAFWNNATNVNFEGSDFIALRKSGLKWRGWIVSRYYQEPYEDTPYPVNIDLTDGLSVLESIFFDDAGTAYTGRMTESEIIIEVLAKIGFTEYKEFVNLYEANMDDGTGDSPFDQAYVDTEVFKDKYCDEVLNALLRKYFASIRQVDGVFCIYRKKELTGATVNGRYFTAADAKTSISITPEQLISRSGDENNLLQVPGGMLMIQSPAKKITIVQDYGYKLSWIKNWEFKADTYDEASSEFEEWEYSGADYAITINGAFRGESDGMLLAIDNKTPATADYRYQIFASWAVDTADEMVIEFDYNFVFWLASGVNPQINIKIQATGISKWLYVVDEETCAWDGSEAFIEQEVVINKGETGWIHFKRYFPGLDVDGTYTITLYTAESSTGSTLGMMGIKNIRFYSTSDEIALRKSAPSALFNLGRRHYKFSFLSAEQALPFLVRKEYYINDVEEIVLREIVKTNSLQGIEKDYDMMLGDVVDCNIDNVVEQFAGALSYRVLMTYTVPKIVRFTKTAAPVNADITIDGEVNTAVWDTNKTTTITNFVGGSPDYGPNIVLTDNGNGTFDAEGYLDFTYSTNVALVTTAVIQALGDPVYNHLPTSEWNTRGGSEATYLGDLIGDELKDQHSRPKQFIQMALRERNTYGDESTVNLIGNFQDSLNQIGGNNRVFVMQAGQFKVKQREWNLDLIEII